MLCTRAGSSMVIDFILVGSVGGGAGVPPLALNATALQVVPADAAAAAADAADGVRHAVTRYGSDHLPVGATVVVRSE